MDDGGDVTYIHILEIIHLWISHQNIRGFGQ